MPSRLDRRREDRRRISSMSPLKLWRLETAGRSIRLRRHHNPAVVIGETQGESHSVAGWLSTFLSTATSQRTALRRSRSRPGTAKCATVVFSTIRTRARTPVVRSLARQPESQ